MVGLSGAATAIAAPAAPTFAPAVTYATGANPAQLTTADFDEDGNLDLAVAVNGADRVDVLFGNGDGTFGPATSFAVGVGDDPGDIIHADVNLDSNEDLLVTNQGPADTTITLLLGDGAGGFTTSSIDLTPNATISKVTVGFVDGDANPDIAVTSFRPIGNTSNAMVLFGNGDGTFDPPLYVNHGGQNPGGVAIGLLDADANTDLVVVNNGSHDFAAMLGNGDGTYGAPVNYSTGGCFPNCNPGTALLMDFDGDGELDLATENGYSGANTIAVRLGVGDGTFGAVALYNAGGFGPSHTTAADFNGDTELDIATSVLTADSAGVLTGNGDGTFNTGVLFPTSGFVAFGIETGDFNEDGLPDLALSNSNSGNVSILLNTTDAVPPNTIIDTSPADPTNSTSASFTFHGVDPAPASLPLTFECARDGGTFAACTSPESYTAAEGQRQFEVRAIDAAGNVDPTPASYSWVVDTTPPTITLTAPANKQHYVLHDPSGASYACNDPLSGSPAAASGVDTCTDNGFDNENLGPHLFTVTATDNAGNSATATSNVYVIDPPRYGDLVDDDDPIAYYRLNDAIGSDPMLDSSGNGHDGEYKNGIALGRQGAIACERRPHPPRACELAADPENKAAYFPPRDGYGYANGIAVPTSGYTMEAWIKPRTSGAMMIMGHGGNAGQLFIQAGGTLAFRQVQDTVAGGPVLTPGQWWHVAGTWNGTTTRLYVNGALIASSNTANKPPSGTGTTFYVGYGEQAPWFHGDIDEVAYYDHALSTHAMEDRYKAGTAFDHPSLAGEDGASPYNTGLPFTDPTAPKNTGLYAPGKTPVADFDCTDADGPADIASCTATVDGNPISSGSPLPDTLGSHTFTVTATDQGTPPNVYVHTHTYTVKSFKDIMGTDLPVAYLRLGDAIGASVMDALFGPDGEYKNGQNSGPVGIAGDGDTARSFEGDGGYGYVDGVAAPRFQSTIEAWIHPTDARDQSIVGHGDAGELFIRDGTLWFRHMFTTVDSGVTATPGVWRQVVGVWDGVDARIYVDGVLASSAEATRRPSSQSTFYVGFGELAPWFYGAIDEVVYYDQALSANRVYQHFLADPPPPLGPGSRPPRDDESNATPQPTPKKSRAACGNLKAEKRAACVKHRKAVAKCKRLKPQRRARCTHKADRAYAAAARALNSQTHRRATAPRAERRPHAARRRARNDRRPTRPAPPEAAGRGARR